MYQIKHEAGAFRRTGVEVFFFFNFQGQATLAGSFQADVSARRETGGAW